MRKSHKSIGPTVSPPWVLVLGLGWLVLGPTARFAVAEQPPRLRLPATATSNGTKEEILLAFLELICALLDCDASGPPLAPTPLMSNQSFSPQAEAEMVDQINAYNASGPLPTLTSGQRSQGRSDASAFLVFLHDNPFLVSDPLRNAYCGMLTGLINDL